MVIALLPYGYGCAKNRVDGRLGFRVKLQKHHLVCP